MAKHELKHSIYTDFDPGSPEVTEFRRICARVARKSQDEKLRTILFTSSEQGEGKTTSAALFSIVACQYQGLRTCLVDADMHRPRLHELFEVPREPGLAEILSDDYAIETTLKPTRYDNLKILSAGSKHPFPSELLIPDRLASVFGKLKLLFDVIVVDAPPLLPVSDSVTLSREVDGVALVVRAGRTKRDVAILAKRMLDDVGANVIGVIVNNMEDVLPYYYGHSYYREYRAQEDDLQETDASRRKPTRRDPPASTQRPSAPRARATGSSG